MKKTLLFIVCLTTVALCSKAQSTKFGFAAGVTFANYHAKVDGEKESGDSKTGITAGLLVDIPISKNFSFQPSLNFTQKGTTDKETYLGITNKTFLRINCIELPLNFLYNASGNTGNFFIGAGPSLAFNVSGKWKFTDETDTYSSDVEFGNSEDDDFKSLDLGANILTGYSFPNGLMLAINYNLGISNLFAEENQIDNSSLKSSYFGVKLGFLLNNMKNRK